MKKHDAVAKPELLDEQGRKPLKLDYKQTFRVGLAFAIIIMFWNAYDFVVPLLLEHAYGLPDWARGVVMGLDNLLSLFMLPLFGKLSDKGHGKLSKKYGKRTPYILLGTLASVALMVFVPVTTLNQQKQSMALEASIQAQLNDGTFMETTLGEWYDNSVSGINGSQNYCDLTYLAKNDMSRDDFIAIRFDENMTSKKAILGMLGEESYFYNGTEITDLSVIEPISGKTYQQILDGNSNYKKYVASGMNEYKSHQVFINITQKTGQTSLAVYMVILLLVLVAMATFRSPAVALMPDVTPRPLRSQANAVINLMGGLGGAISFLIYTVVLFGTSLHNYVIIFSSVAGGMLLLLAGFLALVKEKKMVKRCEEICAEYDIYKDDEEALLLESDVNMPNSADKPSVSGNMTADSATDGMAERLVLTDTEADAGAEPGQNKTLEIAKAKLKKMRSPKEWWGAKTKLERSKFISFMLILASIFMWFMGYNAISSNLSIYITKELNLSAGIASIINGVSMAVSAIAFIPVGYLAAKIGRKKTIMLGYALAIIAFILVASFVKAGDNALVPAALFALFYLVAGFGLIIINVNTFPMVVELAAADQVGQYTGYYYIATMSAQAITPAFAGVVMGQIANRALFIYGAIFVAIAVVLMLFVKHGDSKPVGKSKKATQTEIATTEGDL